MSSEFGTQILLNAIPMPAFIVDEDLVINSVNHAAIDVFNLGGNSIQNEKRWGNLLQCIHSSENTTGCGNGFECKECIIRNSVAECYKGPPIIQRKVTVALSVDGLINDCELLISANQIKNGNHKYALVMIEDMAKLSLTNETMPTCMDCKIIS